jgi:hypothetical protein
MPAIYQYRDFAAAGGVMSYGGNLEPYRLAGLYSGRILKGEPSEMPIQCGTVFTWPLGLRAQQADRIRRVGVLVSQTSDDAEVQTRLTAFQQGLQQLGWTDDPTCGSMYASEGRYRAHPQDVFVTATGRGQVATPTGFLAFDYSISAKWLELLKEVVIE